MITRKLTKQCCIAIATLGIGLGSTAVILRADDMKMGDMSDMHKTMEEQDKAVKDLKAHFDDASFVTIASMANNDEIKAGEAALSTSTNDEVKMFAKHMVDDHTKAGGEMKELAEKKGWHISEICDEKHKMALEELKKLTGNDFDKSYVVGQVKDHEDAVALFKLAADNASDADLKEWVKKEIPTFEEHLGMARKLESKLMTMGS